MTDHEMEYEEQVVTLIDEEGVEHPFAVVEIIEVAGQEYAIMAPMEEGDDEEEDEAVIFRLEIDEETGDELLAEIEDDEEWEMVANAYTDLEEDEE